MAKQLSLASWVSKRKQRRVGDPEERCHVITIHKNKVDRIELTDIARQFIQKMKEERIFLEQYKQTYITSKIYYHIF